MFVKGERRRKKGREEGRSFAMGSIKCIRLKLGSFYLNLLVLVGE